MPGENRISRKKSARGHFGGTVEIDGSRAGKKCPTSVNIVGIKKECIRI
jgi:hypothetical protein